MSYLGDYEDVCNLMQFTSHKTRAYFTNADRLKGFLTPGIVATLKRAKEQGKLKAVALH